MDRRPSAHAIACKMSGAMTIIVPLGIAKCVSFKRNARHRLPIRHRPNFHPSQRSLAQSCCCCDPA